MKKQTEKLTDDERAFALASIEHTKQTREFERAVRWIKWVGLTPRPTQKTCAVGRVRHSMIRCVGEAVSEEMMGIALAHCGFSSRMLGGEWSTNAGMRGAHWAEGGKAWGSFLAAPPVDVADAFREPVDVADAFREPLTPTDALLSAIVQQW